MIENAILPIATLVFVILLSGLLSGTVIYLMNHYSKKWNRYDYLKSLLFGVFFSAIILFFVELTTNGFSDSTKQSPLNYIVFGGLCFLSSIFLSIIFRQRVMRFPKFKK